MFLFGINMAALRKQLCRSIVQIKSNFASFPRISSSLLSPTSQVRVFPCITIKIQPSLAYCTAKPAVETSTTEPADEKINTSEVGKKLMQFFDDEKNWDAQEVKVGRSWTTDDLRIKSNEDLHKLWYVLLKERNMLLTMEHGSKVECELFPNPERLDKVEVSMENLEIVVRERNRAYHELETGNDGERPCSIVRNQLGLPQKYRASEHVIPLAMNTKWQKSHVFSYGGHAVRKFLRLYREKLANQKYAFEKRQELRVASILKKFPNVNEEALSAKYPEVNIQKVRESKMSHGNHEFNS